MAELTRTSTDVEVAPFLARFLVIRSSGYLEQTVFEVARGYVNGKSGGLVRSFAHSWLEKTRNPTADNLRQLVGRFDQSLREEFDDLMSDDDERLSRELAFLIDRRNQIAHGLSEGINRGKALALKEVATDLADWFILKYNPARTTV